MQAPRNEVQAPRNEVQAPRNEIQAGWNEIQIQFLPQIAPFQRVATNPNPQDIWRPASVRSGSMTGRRPENSLSQPCLGIIDLPPAISASQFLTVTRVQIFRKHLSLRPPASGQGDPSGRRPLRDSCRTRTTKWMTANALKSGRSRRHGGRVKSADARDRAQFTTHRTSQRRTRFEVMEYGDLAGSLNRKEPGFVWLGRATMTIAPEIASAGPLSSRAEGSTSRLARRFSGHRAAS